MRCTRDEGCAFASHLLVPGSGAICRLIERLVAGRPAVPQRPDSPILRCAEQKGSSHPGPPLLFGRLTSLAPESIIPLPDNAHQESRLFTPRGCRPTNSPQAPCRAGPLLSPRLIWIDVSFCCGAAARCVADLAPRTASLLSRLQMKVGLFPCQWLASVRSCAPGLAKKWLTSAWGRGALFVNQVPNKRGKQK